MRWGAALATLAGLLLAGWLLSAHGLAEIVGLLRRAGWGLLPVAAFHALQLLASSEAWRMATAPAGRPGPAAFLLLRWIREGVNAMLPVAQIGGEVVGARLLHRRGVALPDAIAGSAGDMAVGVLTQVLFTLAGLGLLVALTGLGSMAAWVLAGGTLAAAGALAAGLRSGLVGMAWRWVEGWADRASARLGWTGADAHGVGDALRALGRGHGLARCAALHVLSWVLGGAEVCLALHVLGAPVGFGEGLAIEALGQAVRSAGFVVPAGIGVAEGGFVAAGALFGVPAELALALALMKRLREVAYGLPALVAWQVLERHGAAKARAPA